MSSRRRPRLPRQYSGEGSTRPQQLSTVTSFLADEKPPSRARAAGSSGGQLAAPERTFTRERWPLSAACYFFRRTSSSGADQGYGSISMSAGSATRGPTPLGQKDS